MYEETVSFTPHTTNLQEVFVQSENGFSMEEFLNTYPQNPIFSPAIEIDLQKQLNFMNNNEIHNQEMNSFNGDLLNMFSLARSLSPNSSLPFSNSSFMASLGLLGGLDLVADGSSASAPSVVYDPLLNLPPQPQPPLMRDLFKYSLPHGGFAGFGDLGINGSLFGGVDERDDIVNGGLVYEDDDVKCFDNGVFEFSAKRMDFIDKNSVGKDNKNERDRRVLMSDKYQVLRKLVPHPTKNDRASIVSDAIEYINELKSEVNEAKFRVERKRCARERLKRSNTTDGSINDSNSHGDMDTHNGSSHRSSWLHRKSKKNTVVDVRIIDDEVTVKIVQQKRIMNCLILVSKVLDELKLDLHHVAGGLIGDYYSFLFNSKICDGSRVYAGAIANKLMEVVDN